MRDYVEPYAVNRLCLSMRNVRDYHPQKDYRPVATGIYPPSGFYIPTSAEFHPRGEQPSIIKKKTMKKQAGCDSFPTLIAYIAGTNVHLIQTVGSLGIRERPHAHKYIVYITILHTRKLKSQEHNY